MEPLMPTINWLKEILFNSGYTLLYIAAGGLLLVGVIFMLIYLKGAFKREFPVSQDRRKHKKRWKP